MLRVENLSVKTDQGDVIVHPVSFELLAGEALTIVGETGSGKTLIAQAIANTLPDDLIATGKIYLHDKPLHELSTDERNALWGEALCVLPQEPMRALDPTMTSGKQICEGYKLVRKVSASEAKSRTNTDLDKFALSQAKPKYPHELSGGMAQRVAFLSARAGGATFTIVDEPTKGLDASKRDDVSALLRQLADNDEGVLTITHDIEVAHQLGGQVIILREGTVVEIGKSSDVLNAPRQNYTKQLINADPRRWTNRQIINTNVESDIESNPLVEVKNISKTRGDKTLFNDLSLALRPQQIIGVSGDSGCGKSTLGDMMLGLLAADAGEIMWQDAPKDNQKRLAEKTFAQKIFQDPSDVFSAHVKLKRSFRDVMKKHRVDAAQLDSWLATLKLDKPMLERYPDQVSGGELQRLAIARVMLVKPKFIFADEPTSRLDMLTQQSVIDALVDVVEQNHVGMMLVSHDRALLDKVCDDVIVL